MPFSMSQLDHEQILRAAFDDASGRLKVGIDATIAGGQEILISQVDDSIQVAGFRGTMTDRSGATSATPSTSTQIMAANTSRKYLLIQNLDAANDIYVNFGAAAAVGASGSIWLKAGGGAIVMESSFIPTGSVNVISAGTSVAFTAKEV